MTSEKRDKPPQTPARSEERRPDTPADTVLGLRAGKGLEQYGGSYGAGQSGGGAYPNPHSGRDAGSKREQDSRSSGPDTEGQSEQAYYGGGQAGADNRSENDHTAASRQGGPATDTGSYRDHPSQNRTTPDGERFVAANRRRRPRRSGAD